MTDKEADNLIEKMKAVFPTAEMTNKSFQTLTDTMTASFASVNVRFDETAKKVDARFDKVEVRLDHIDARLATIERDVKEVIHREEFDDLMARVKYVEKKLGIESGK